MDKKQHTIDIIFVLSLFCAFAVLALFVVVLGANVYKGISADMTRNFDARTSVAYLSEKIRQNDVQGGISVENVNGADALVLRREADGKTYETWVYVQDGWLSEVTVAQGTDVAQVGGEPVMELASMEISRNGKLFSIGVEDMSGNRYTGTVYGKADGV